MDSPRCIRSNPSLMFSSGRIWVIRSSILSLPSIYQSTIFGTSVRPRAPPKADPFHCRPVTNWNGRVEISAPASATPIIIDWPHPFWHHSIACPITLVLPIHSHEYPAPPSVLSTILSTPLSSPLVLMKFLLPPFPSTPTPPAF